jgi:maltooligosyltrehalose trehalohydrolase
VPLLFMGEEYGEERPFPFFCSFEDPVIIEAVQRGRRREFADLEFHWKAEITDPQDPRTLAAAKLAWAWPEGSPQAQLRHLYQDLLRARRRWPALRDRRQTAAWLLGGSGPQAAAEPPLLLIERGGERGILAVANLTGTPQSIATLELSFNPEPTATEPTAIDLANRELLLSSEDPRYGGCRSGDHSFEQIFPHELLIFSGKESPP